MNTERFGLRTYMKKQDELRLKLENKELTHKEYLQQWKDNYNAFFGVKA